MISPPPQSKIATPVVTWVDSADSGTQSSSLVIVALVGVLVVPYQAFESNSSPQRPSSVLNFLTIVFGVSASFVSCNFSNVFTPHSTAQHFSALKEPLSTQQQTVLSSSTCALLHIRILQRTLQLVSIVGWWLVGWSSCWNGGLTELPLATGFGLSQCYIMLDGIVSDKKLLTFAIHRPHSECLYTNRHFTTGLWSCCLWRMYLQLSVFRWTLLRYFRRMSWSVCLSVCDLRAPWRQRWPFHQYFTSARSSGTRTVFVKISGENRRGSRS